MNLTRKEKMSYNFRMSKKDKTEQKPSGKQEAERRKEIRVHKDLHVKIFAGGQYFSGVSKNLSCGGVLIRAPKDVLGKDLEHLSIPLLDNEKPLEVDAEVAWSNSGREDEIQADDDVNIGFQFKDLDEDMKEQIQSYIDEFIHNKKK